MQNYDFQYIDTQIIGGIEKNLPSVLPVMQQIERKATGKVGMSMSMSTGGLQNDDAVSRASGDQPKLNASASMPPQEDSVAPVKLCTIPKPFNLTKPKPKMMPMPMALK